jgi:hypothetical protein
MDADFVVEKSAAPQNWQTLAGETLIFEKTRPPCQKTLQAKANF